MIYKFFISVSIPDRYAKNWFESNIMLVEPEFQFLIGTLKTEETPFNRMFGDVVSIPDRYAKNWWPQPEREPPEEFQFLIGTLKTKKNRKEKWISDYSFNS